MSCTFFQEVRTLWLFFAELNSLELQPVNVQNCREEFPTIAEVIEIISQISDTHCRTILQGDGERMLSMTSISEIRRMYFEEGYSLSEIERKSRYDGKTIRKYIRKTDFTYQEEMDNNGKVKKSKLDTYKEIIDGWFVEDKKYRKKQRHTAKRVFDRLCEERKDFDCSYRLVAGYVKEKRRELYSNKDVFFLLECYSYFKLSHAEFNKKKI